MDDENQLEALAALARTLGDTQAGQALTLACLGWRREREELARLRQAAQAYLNVIPFDDAAWMQAGDALQALLPERE